MSELWEIVKDGGALGVAVVFIAYLIRDNRAYRDRLFEALDKQREASATTNGILERLAERIKRGEP